MKFKKDPIKTKRNKVKQITAGSDSIIEINGEFFLKERKQRVVLREDLAARAIALLRERNENIN